MSATYPTRQLRGGRTTTYRVRFWIPAAVAGLDLFAYLAAEVAASSPHISVLDVTLVGSEVLIVYQVLALGVVEVFALMSAGIARGEPLSGLKAPFVRRCDITLIDPGGPLPDASADRSARRID